jgi:hypothetical protein
MPYLKTLAKRADEPFRPGSAPAPALAVEEAAPAADALPAVPVGHTQVKVPAAPAAAAAPVTARLGQMLELMDPEALAKQAAEGGTGEVLKAMREAEKASNRPFTGVDRKDVYDYLVRGETAGRVGGIPLLDEGASLQELFTKSVLNLPPEKAAQLEAEGRQVKTVRNLGDIVTDAVAGSLKSRYIEQAGGDKAKGAAAYREDLTALQTSMSKEGEEPLTLREVEQRLANEYGRRMSGLDPAEDANVLLAVARDAAGTTLDFVETGYARRFAAQAPITAVSGEFDPTRWFEPAREDEKLIVESTPARSERLAQEAMTEVPNFVITNMIGRRGYNKDFKPTFPDLIEAARSRGPVSMEGVEIKPGAVVPEHTKPFLGRLRAEVDRSIPLMVTSGFRDAHYQSSAIVTKRTEAERLQALGEDPGTFLITNLYKTPSGQQMAAELLTVDNTTEAMAPIIQRYMDAGMVMSDHMKGEGEALDIRVRRGDKPFTKEERTAIVVAAEKLGAQAIDEGDHVHIENLTPEFAAQFGGVAPEAPAAPLPPSDLALREAETRESEDSSLGTTMLGPVADFVLPGSSEELYKQEEVFETTSGFQMVQAPSSAFDVTEFTKAPWMARPGTAQGELSGKAIYALQASDSELFDQIIDIGQEGIGRGMRQVTRLIYERKKSGLDAARRKGLPQDEYDKLSQELSAEAAREAVDVITSAQFAGLWTAPVLTSFDELMGLEPETGPIDSWLQAISPKIELVGRNGDEIIYRQQGGGMALLNVLDAVPVIGQGYNVGVLQNYIAPDLGAFLDSPSMSSAVALGARGAKVGVAASILGSGLLLASGDLAEIHAAGVRGVAENANLVEFYMDTSVAATSWALDTGAGEAVLGTAVEAGLPLPIPDDISSPANRLLAAKDAARGLARLAVLPAGFAAAVLHPDMIGGLASAYHGGMKGVRTFAAVPDAEKLADALIVSGRYGGRQEMFLDGVTRQEAINDLLVAALAETNAAEEVVDGQLSAAAQAVLREQAYEALDAGDLLDAARRKKAPAPMRKVDTESGEILVGMAQGKTTENPTTGLQETTGGGHIGATAALDANLSARVYAILEAAVEKGKESGDAARVAQATELGALLEKLGLKGSITLSPGLTDKAAKEALEAGQAFNQGGRVRALHLGLALFDDIEDSAELRVQAFNGRLDVASSEFAGVHAADVPVGDAGLSLRNALNVLGPVEADALQAAMTAKHIGAERQVELLAQHAELAELHGRFVAMVESGEIVTDPAAREALKAEFIASGLVDGSGVFLYKNSTSAKKGGRYRDVFAGIIDEAAAVNGASSLTTDLQKGLAGVLTAATARAEATKNLARRLVDPDVVGGEHMVDAFLDVTGGGLRADRAVAAFMSGTREGLLNLIAASPIVGPAALRKLAPDDAARLTGTGSKAAARAKLAQMKADGSDPGSLARATQVDVLQRLQARLQGLVELEDEGDEVTGAMTELRAAIARVASPEWRLSLVQWIRQSAAAVNRGEAAFPFDDLPIAVDAGIFRKGDRKYQTSKATTEFAKRFDFLDAYGFAGEKERAAQKMSPKKRTVKAELSGGEKKAMLAVMDQMVRFMVFPEGTEGMKAVAIEAGLRDWYTTNIANVRRVGTNNAAAKELKALHGEFAVRVTAKVERILGMTVDEFKAQEGFTLDPDVMRRLDQTIYEAKFEALDEVLQQMTEVEALLLFQRSRAELEAEVAAARQAPLDEPFVATTLFQDAAAAGAEGDDVAEATRLWNEVGVESPYFKRWFGESKVVDDEGQPLIVYHGTGLDFDEFDGEYTRHFFTTDANSAATFADMSVRTNRFGTGKASIVPAYVSLRNPLVVDVAGGAHDNIRFLKKGGRYPDYETSMTSGEISRQVAAEGTHDGVIFLNMRDAAYGSVVGATRTERLAREPATVVAAFDPTQVKSVNNRGTFDDSARILFQDAAAAGAEGDDVAKAARLWDELGVESPYFKRWFGDSKVVDEAGEPLVVYHGTPFGKFDDKARRRNALLEQDAVKYRESLEPLEAIKERIGEAREVVAEMRQEGLAATRRAEERKEVLRGGWTKGEYGDARFDDVYEGDKVWREATADADKAFADAREAHREFEKPLLAERNRLRVPEPPTPSPVPDEAFNTHSTGQTDFGHRASGSYFTDSQGAAEGYAQSGVGSGRDSYVYEVYLSFKRPYVNGTTKDAEFSQELSDNIRMIMGRTKGIDEAAASSRERDIALARRRILEKHGYDSEVWPQKDGTTEYIAFDPTQVKSVNNRGTFDDSARILFQDEAAATRAPLHDDDLPPEAYEAYELVFGPVLGRDDFAAVLQGDAASVAARLAPLAESEEVGSKGYRVVLADLAQHPALQGVPVARFDDTGRVDGRLVPRIADLIQREGRLPIYYEPDAAFPRGVLFFPEDVPWVRTPGVITHELVHAATISIMVAALDVDARAAGKVSDAAITGTEKMLELFGTVKQMLGEEHAGEYGLSNLYEFVAEGLSNADFQALLSRVHLPGGPTLWSWFVDGLLSVLGLTQEGQHTALDELVRNYAEITGGDLPAAPRAGGQGVSHTARAPRPGDEQVPLFGKAVAPAPGVPVAVPAWIARFSETEETPAFVKVEAAQREVEKAQAALDTSLAESKELLRLRTEAMDQKRAAKLAGDMKAETKADHTAVRHNERKRTVDKGRPGLERAVREATEAHKEEELRSAPIDSLELETARGDLFTAEGEYQSVYEVTLKMYVKGNELREQAEIAQQGGRRGDASSLLSQAKKLRDDADRMDGDAQTAVGDARLALERAEARPLIDDAPASTAAPEAADDGLSELDDVFAEMGASDAGEVAAAAKFDGMSDQDIALAYRHRKAAGMQENGRFADKLGRERAVLTMAAHDVEQAATFAAAPEAAKAAPPAAAPAPAAPVKVDKAKAAALRAKVTKPKPAKATKGKAKPAKVEEPVVEETDEAQLDRLTAKYEAMTRPALVNEMGKRGLKMPAKVAEGERDVPRMVGALAMDSFVSSEAKAAADAAVVVEPAAKGALEATLKATQVFEPATIDASALKGGGDKKVAAGNAQAVVEYRHPLLAESVERVEPREVEVVRLLKDKGQVDLTIRVMIGRYTKWRMAAKDESAEEAAAVAARISEKGKNRAALVEAMDEAAQDLDKVPNNLRHTKGKNTYTFTTNLTGDKPFKTAVAALAGANAELKKGVAGTKPLEAAEVVERLDEPTTRLLADVLQAVEDGEEVGVNIATLKKVAPDDYPDEKLKALYDLLRQEGVLVASDKPGRLGVSPEAVAQAQARVKDLIAVLDDDTAALAAVDVFGRIDARSLEALTAPDLVVDDEVNAFLVNLKRIAPEEFEALVEAKGGYVATELKRGKGALVAAQQKLAYLEKSLPKLKGGDRRKVRVASIRAAQARVERLTELNAQLLVEVERMKAVSAKAVADAAAGAPPPKVPGAAEVIVEEVDPLPKGMVHFLDDTSAILYAFKQADASTGLHEMSHVLRRNLGDADMRRVLEWANGEIAKEGHAPVELLMDPRSGRLNFASRMSPDSVIEVEELFARAFERYLREGSTQNSALQSAFAAMKQVLARIYAAIKGSKIDVHISEDMYKLFDQVFGATTELRIEDMPELQRYLDLQQTISRGNTMRAGGRIAEQAPVEDTFVEGLRQTAASVADYRATLWETKTGKTEGPGSRANVTEALGPVSRRVLTTPQLAAMGANNNFAANLAAAKFMGVSLQTLDRGTVALASATLAVAHAALFGDDAAKVLRAAPVAVRATMNGFSRELEEFMSELSMRIIDVSRTSGLDRARAITQLIGYMAGEQAVMQTGAQRGQRSRANFVDASAHFFRFVVDRVSKASEQSREVLARDTEHTLLQMTGRSGVPGKHEQSGSLSGFWKGYNIVPAAEVDKSSAFAEGLVLDEALAGTLAGSKAEKLQQANELSGDALTNIYMALTGEEGLPKGSEKAMPKAQRLAALMVFYAGETKVTVDGVDFTVDDLSGTSSVLEALFLGHTFEKDGVKLVLPGLDTTKPGAFDKVSSNQRIGTLVLMGQSGYVAGLFDDMRRTGFGVSAVDARAYAHYVAGNADLLSPAEIDRAQSVATLYGHKAAFKLSPDSVGDYYIPSAVREKLGENLSQGLRMVGLTGEDQPFMNGLTKFGGYMLSTLIFGGLVQRQAFKFMSTTDLGFQIGLIVGGAEGAAAASRAAALTLLSAVGGERGAEVAEATLTAAYDIAGKTMPRILSETAFKARLRSMATQNADEAVAAVTEFLSLSKFRVEVNPILDNQDFLYALGGRVYNARDLRRAFTRAGMYSNAFKEVKSVLRADRSPGSLERNTALMDESGVSDANRALVESATDNVDGFFSGVETKKRVRRWGSTAMEHGLESADAWSDLERTGAAVTLMEFGYTPEDAARLVVESIYDYRGSMGEKDRHWVRRIAMPFWSFRKNANTQAANLVASPQGAYRMMALSRATRFGAESLTSVIYEALLQPYDVNISAMPPAVKDMYYDMRSMLEYGYGDAADKEVLAEYRASLPEEQQGISDEELLDHSFDGWTIREGYKGYGAVPADVQIAFRALLAGRSSANIRNNGTMYNLMGTVTQRAVRDEYVKLGASMAVRDEQNLGGLPAWAAKRPTIQFPIPVLTESVQEMLELTSGDSFYMVLPDNFIMSASEHVGSMFMTMAVLGAMAAKTGPLSGEINAADGVKLLNALEPLVDFRDYASPQGEMIHAVSEFMAEGRAPRVRLHPIMARAMEGTYGTSLPHEGETGNRAGVPYAFRLAAQGVTRAAGLSPGGTVFAGEDAGGMRSRMFSTAKHVQVIDGKREVVPYDYFLHGAEFTKPGSEGHVAYTPYLYGVSALTFSLTPTGQMNKFLLDRFGDGPIEQSMEAQAEVQNFMLNLALETARTLGVRVNEADYDRSAALDKTPINIK